MGMSELMTDGAIKPAVLLAVRPLWTDLIESGAKTLEIRKTRPKLETPFWCYLYETTEKTELPRWRDSAGRPVFRGRGAVIGEFLCDEIRAYALPYPAYQSELDKELQKAACVDYWMLHRYVWSGGTFYAWHISELKIYDKPKALYCFKNRGRIERPPQSWMYVMKEEVA